MLLCIDRAKYKLAKLCMHLPRSPAVAANRFFSNITSEDREFLEAEAKRTKVLTPEERQALYLEKKKNRLAVEESESDFSDKYLAQKGISFDSKSDHSFVDQNAPPRVEMDPKLLAEISKWNIVSQKNVAPESSGADLAVMVRIKELEECEKRADKRGNYTIPGRLTEIQMRDLLFSVRTGKNIDTIVTNNHMNRAAVEELLKYTRAPVFEKPPDGDDYVICK